MSRPLVAERYRILARVGQGGLGVVYRVEDLVEREIRALKVMPRAAGRGNLRAEFLALARLSHDNIVRVHDFGRTPQGDDFYTMDLVRGGDFLAAAPRPPDPAFYRVAGGVLRALAFLHARGIVHADVKPSNILVDEELLAADPARAARLVDFGLAAATSDPASAVARGTFPYAAPEVYAGRLDARSDLYALGVVLYEVVTGHRPFDGRDVAAVIRSQRQGPPADPRTLRADVPPELAELILALTEPEPGARPQTADEVLARINEIAGTDFLVSSEPPKVDLTGALVGRERDVAALWGAWERAAGPAAGEVVLVTGEEGIGKSRLLGELKLRVQLGDGRIFVASAAPSHASPYGGLADVVRALLLDAGERPTAAGAPARRAALAPLLGEAGGALVTPETRYALAEAVAALLLEAAAAAPIAVVLDDLHAATRATLDLYAYLARAVGAGRVLLVGAARADAVDGGPVAGLAGALANVQRLMRIDLPPLDRASVRALVAGIFGAEIAEAIGVDLHRASGGNPAFLERTLHALVERGVLGRQRGRWTLEHHHPIPLPVDAVAAAQARFARLPAAVRVVVEAAAVLGERFDVDTLVTVLALPGPEVSDGVAAAVAARVLEGEPGGETLAFTPPPLRDAIYGALDHSRRLALHRDAAAALEARARDGRVVAGALAEHLLALGDGERALTAAIAAADACVRVADHHGALRWAERVLPLAKDDRRVAAELRERLADARAAVGDAAAACDDLRRAHDDRDGDVAAQVRIARKLAELLRQRGESDEAIDGLMRALGQARAARRTADEAWTQYTLARVRMYRGEYAAAVEHAAAGLALARAAGERELCALLARTRADVEVFRGDSRGALAHVEAALAEAGDGDEPIVAELHLTRGRASVHAGDYRRAIESLERALVTYQRLGRVEQEARVLNNLGAACYHLGAWDRAQASWERFLQLCERMDDAQELATALNNLGHLHGDRGELTEALALLDRARAVAARIGRAHTVGWSLGNRGEVLLRQGDLKAARECFERCLSLFEELGAREDLIETRRRLCELDLASGRVDLALDRAIDAARDAHQAGVKLEEATLHRVAASALRRQGDADAALWFLEKARELVTALGAGYERAKVDVEAAELEAAAGRGPEAEAHLSHAIETFAALGARWDLSQARERKRAIHATTSTMPVDAEPLPRGGLQVLLDVALAAGRMELEKLLEILLDKILEVTRFERGFLLLLDDRGRPTERMRRVRGEEAGEFDHEHADFSGSIVRRVAHTGEPVAVIDVADDDGLRNQRSVVALGLRSVMCVPMRLQGRVSGIIYVDSRRLADDDHAGDLALLEALAAQAAIAVENARLVAEEQRKNELMAILAHEIRNPLAGILGFSDLLPDESAEMPPKYVHLVGRIHQDAQRLKRLVDNILELARVEAGKVEWTMSSVPVGKLVREAHDAFEGLAAKKRIDLAATIEPGLPGVVGNADRLFQVLSNLLSNALKFTPDGGQITLTARAEAVVPGEGYLRGGDDASAWRPRSRADDRPRLFIRVDVADSGPGIPPPRRAHLFEKFAQGEGGKRAAHGVGLGLYISREIVRRHGGSIWVESEPGKGTCFSFRIPAAL